MFGSIVYRDEQLGGGGGSERKREKRHRERMYNKTIKINLWQIIREKQIMSNNKKKNRKKKNNTNVTIVRGGKKIKNRLRESKMKIQNLRLPKNVPCFLC